MKRLFIALACIALSTSCHTPTADEPASRDDVISLLRAMHANDIAQQRVAAQSQGLQQLLHDEILKDKGTLPADFDALMNKSMVELIKGVPVEEMTLASVPAYQKHFTHAEVEAMRAFYSSSAGQKVIEQLPVVMEEGAEAATPVMSRYLGMWKGRIEMEMSATEKNVPKNSGQNSSPHD